MCNNSPIYYIFCVMIVQNYTVCQKADKHYPHVQMLFSDKFTRVARILHDRRSHRSRQISTLVKLILLSMFVALPVRGFTFGDYFWEFALKSAGSSRRGKLNQQYIGIVAENCCILSFLGYPSPIFLQRLR